MIRPLILTALLCASHAAFAQSQPQFEVAQIQQAQSSPGRVYERITTDPGRLRASGVTLKQLIFEAYDMPYSRIFGGPSWLDSETYDLEAKAETAVSHAQLKLMLRALLAERFKLTLHRETRELKYYALTVAKNGPKLHAAKDSGTSSDHGLVGFRGDLTQFANLLALRLNMPMVMDPTAPVRSAGVPPPVLNKTGIEGVFDISIGIKPDPEADAFILWQRVLQDELGLKLESQKGPVEVLVIDHTERVPTEN